MRAALSEELLRMKVLVAVKRVNGGYRLDRLQIDATAPKITAEVAASELSKIFQSFAQGGQKAADTVSNKTSARSST